MKNCNDQLSPLILHYQEFVQVIAISLSKFLEKSPKELWHFLNFRFHIDNMHHLLLALWWYLNNYRYMITSNDKPCFVQLNIKLFMYLYVLGFTIVLSLHKFEYTNNIIWLLLAKYFISTFPKLWSFNELITTNANRMLCTSTSVRNPTCLPEHSSKADKYWFFLPTRSD